MPLHQAKVALSLLIGVPDQVYERHSPSSPEVVGRALMEQVSALEQQRQLGYYPALDFFQEQGGVDPELINAAENLAWLGSTLVREEIQVRLRGVFSSVKIESIQCQAFTMPAVRPNAPHAMEKLQRHYTPDTIRVDMRVTVIRKAEAEEGIAQLARQMAQRWLKDVFEDLVITSATRVE